MINFLARFKLHEPVYRQAEKEWKDFIDKFTELMLEADPQIPFLPAKDVVHRIYRDASHLFFFLDALLMVHPR